MFEKKYTKVALKCNEEGDTNRVFVELIYNTRYFKITSTEGGEILLNLDEVRAVAEVAEEFAG